MWCTFAGVAQGGNFAVIFTVIASTAGSPAAARADVDATRALTTTLKAKTTLKTERVRMPAV